jgi:hypothetical protein
VKPLGQHLLVDLFECDADAISSLQVVMFGAGRVSQARLERGVLGPRVEARRDRLPT